MQSFIMFLYKPSTSSFDFYSLKPLFWLFVIDLFYTYLIADTIGVYLGLNSYEINFSNIELSGILSAVILAPIVEEGIFHTPLRLNSKYVWLFALIAALSIISFMPNAYGFALGIVVFFILAFIIEFKKDMVLSYFQGYFTILFYSTALLFALVHHFYF